MVISDAADIFIVVKLQIAVRVIIIVGTGLGCRIILEIPQAALVIVFFPDGSPPTATSPYKLQRRDPSLLER